MPKPKRRKRVRHIATANIKVRILGDASALRAEIDSMQDKLNRAFGGEAMAVSRTFAGVLAGTAVAMSGIGVAAIKAAAGLEQTKMAFTSMLGSAQKANEFLEELKDFAAHTPFEFAQVKGAAQKFLAFGFTAKQIIPTLTAVGDAASAMGMGEDGINRLTLALGQMAAKGKVSGEEMRQLAEAGIPAWQMLADSIGVSIPEAMKLAESGAINAQQGLEAIVNGMNDKFSGMMDVQSQTFSGLISTIKDNTTQLLEAIGTELIDALNLKELAAELGTFLNDFREQVQSVGIGEALKRLIPPEVMAAVAALAGAITAAAIPALAGFAIAIGGALASVLPFIAIGAALGVAAYSIWRNFEQLKAAVAELGKRFTGIAMLCQAFKAALTSIMRAGQSLLAAFKPIAKFIAVILVAAVSAAVGMFLVFVNTVAYVASGVAAAVTNIVNFMNWAFSLVGNILNRLGAAFMNIANNVLPTWASNSISVITDFVGRAMGFIDGLIGALSKVGQMLGIVSDAASGSGGDGGGLFDNIKQAAQSAADVVPISFSNFGGGGSAPAIGGGGGGGSAGGGGVSEEEQKAKQMLDDARQISKQIGEEWAQTFSTKAEMVEKWYAEETAELEKSKTANENYERDKTRLAELYAHKRIEALQEEATKAAEIARQIRDAWLDFNDATELKNATGAAALFMEMDSAHERATNSIRDRWEKLANDFAGMTEREQDTFVKALQERGIAYEMDAGNRISFAEMANREIAASDADYYRQRQQMLIENKDIEAEIKAAYDEMDFARLQEALSAENVARLEQHEFKKQLLDEYKEATMNANLSMQEMWHDVQQGGLGELEKGISGLIQGTTTLQQVFTNLGKTVLKVVADTVAGWIKGMLQQSLFQKAQKAQTVAVEAGTAAAVAAAWLPAAINVLIATGGKAGAMAMSSYGATAAGITGQFSAAGMLNAASLGGVGMVHLASGGLATGTTVATIGEGSYPEAVLPLSDETFDRMGEGISRNSNSGGTVVIQAIDADSFSDFLEYRGGRAFKQYIHDEAQRFATESGGW